MLKFTFSNETKTKASKAAFKKLTDKSYKALKARIDKLLLKRDGLVDLVIIDDIKMLAMNMEYRGKDSTTDVISFAYLEVTEYEKEKGDIIVADIFISADTAARQAKEKKHSLKKELETLFVHGLLHCLGFDHKSDKQEKEMEKWAKKILG